MRFSVSLQAEGDREVTLDEVVELADAVAGLGGIASGFGTMSYGAQIIVDAETSDEAVEIALEQFNRAVASTSLPAWPVARAETIGEDDDYGDLDP
ncbi:MAG: hypothetical protein FJW80_07045 [Actinobacteria bacterium]|nr:hypothetical protein [Actinomycetota bacterium]